MSVPDCIPQRSPGTLTSYPPVSRGPAMPRPSAVSCCGAVWVPALRPAMSEPRSAQGSRRCWAVQCCSRCSRLRPASLSWPVNIYDPFTRFFLPSCERFAAFSCWKESKLLLGAVARKTKGAFLEPSSTHSSWLWLLSFLAVPALQQRCAWSCWLQRAPLSTGVLQQSAAHGRSTGGGWWSRSAPQQQSMLSTEHWASHRAFRPQGAATGL